MNLKVLKQKLIPILEPYTLDIYSIRLKNEYGERVVEILIDTDTIDVLDLEKIHRSFMDVLDDGDLDDDCYLEISSLGLERPIETLDDLKKAIGAYVYVEVPKYHGNATVISLDGDVMTLEINDKGRFRKIDAKWDQATNMRYAVKV